MYPHPARQVNVYRKGVLCVPNSSKFFETPCVGIKSVWMKQELNSPRQLLCTFHFLGGGGGGRVGGLRLCHPPYYPP